MQRNQAGYLFFFFDCLLLGFIYPETLFESRRNHKDSFLYRICVPLFERTFSSFFPVALELHNDQLHLLLCGHRNTLNMTNDRNLLVPFICILHSENDNESLLRRGRELMWETHTDDRDAGR